MKDKISNIIFFTALNYGRKVIDLERGNDYMIRLSGDSIKKTTIYQLRILKSKIYLLIGRILLNYAKKS
jgi:hypothetical protein